MTTELSQISVPSVELAVAWLRQPESPLPFEVDLVPAARQTTLVILQGEVATHTAPRFRDALLAALDQGARAIVVDLARGLTHRRHGTRGDRTGRPASGSRRRRRGPAPSRPGAHLSDLRPRSPSRDPRDARAGPARVAQVGRHAHRRCCLSGRHLPGDSRTQASVLGLPSAPPPLQRGVGGWRRHSGRRPLGKKAGAHNGPGGRAARMICGHSKVRGPTCRQMRTCVEELRQLRPTAQCCRGRCHGMQSNPVRWPQRSPGCSRLGRNRREWPGSPTFARRAEPPSVVAS